MKFEIAFHVSSQAIASNNRSQIVGLTLAIARISIECTTIVVYVKWNSHNCVIPIRLNPLIGPCGSNGSKRKLLINPRWADCSVPEAR